jgi:N-acetylmuramoyl-L-alanine amidase
MPHDGGLLRLPFACALLAALLAGVLVQAQGAPPAVPLSLLSRDGRRPVPTIILNNQELIALDDVANLFQVAVREDALAGGVTVTYRGRTIVASSEQPMVSVNGRLVALPSPVIRLRNRWFVPVEFLSRALAPIYDARIDLRRASRLLIVGDLRVPRAVVRFEQAGPPTRFTIDANPATTATVTQESGLLLIRLDADALDATLPSGGAGLIEQIRPGDQPATIVAQLTPRAGAYRVTSLAEATGTQTTIEVMPAETTDVAPPPPPAPPAVADPLPPIAMPRAVLQTVVIDPGHGGAETGATGTSGTVEKQITLEVARRIKATIEARLGIRVLLTREDDRAVGADERAALANNNKAELFLSLHLNGAPSTALKGAEVFYLHLDREGEAARRAAEAESVALPALGGGSRPIDVIRWDLAQARHIESSAILASMLEEELRTRVEMGPRPIQQAPLRVLVGANMPAALIEMAYLTNQADEQRVTSADFQAAMTQAIYETVLRFRHFLEGRR